MPVFTRVCRIGKKNFFWSISDLRYKLTYTNFLRNLRKTIMLSNETPNKKQKPLFRFFRKYHRILAIILCLPLFLTVITGTAYTIAVDWFELENAAELLLGLHTLEIIHLEKFYPVLNGIGLIGLLVTGMTMTNLFKKRKNVNQNPE